MSNLKYSRQRESIKEYLRSTNEHPCADTVYSNVKLIYPNLSLGTVYRNLNLLAERKEIQRVPTPLGKDRFDANAEPHNHFFCSDCGKIIDFEINEEHRDAYRVFVEEGLQGIMEAHTTEIYGSCSDCVS